MIARFRHLLLAFGLMAAVVSSTAEERVYLDDQGVVRWRSDGSEVTLFGANYSLGSASDYRAAGRLGVDRKQLVADDMAHFARMGWDGVRLATWGDWESSDHEGNLIVNDHIDVFDYAVYQAKQRGIHILFNPIHTYSAWWPDADPEGDYPGFANHFEKFDLGRLPAAITAQQNFIRQFLNHVNPYTGLAIKDEPQILFIEMINEPWHHPDDFPGSVDYINALVEAVRDTGCRKLTFHNITQDFGIIPATRASRVDGGSVGWYPTGLNLKRQLTNNHLRSVDDYAPLLRPDVRNMPLVAYEFDSADMDSGYMYPAMARAFRGVGVQFAAMFSYDMLATAPTNGGWQTHWMNLVYSPKKAVSGIIAAEVMRRIPADSRYGDYPQNREFGPFRVSYEEDTSELVTNEVFMHASRTRSAPAHPEKLQRIVGRLDSPLVSYEGSGAYFFDRLSEGIWRLEVYPDAEMIRDPFTLAWDAGKTASRLIERQWPMVVNLPDLADSFVVTPLDSGNTHSAVAIAGAFPIRPGVYLLSRHPEVDVDALPERVGHLGLREFVSPKASRVSPTILPRLPQTAPADQPLVLEVDFISESLPGEMVATAVGANQAERRFTLKRSHRYTYQATVPAGTLSPGNWSFGFQGKVDDNLVSLEHDSSSAPSLRMVDRHEPLVLFDAEAADLDLLVYSRGPWEIRQQVFPHLAGDDIGGFVVSVPDNPGDLPPDLTAQLAVRDRIHERRHRLKEVDRIRLELKTSGNALPVSVTLLESDGTAWSARLVVPKGTHTLEIPMDELHLDRGVLLPQGYPNTWSYWVNPAADRGGKGDEVRLRNVEHLQLSLRPTGESSDVKGPGKVTVYRITVPLQEPIP